jgi:alpha-beta hydrolase superfamily lysophospholipase
MKILKKSIEFYADNTIIRGVLHLPEIQAPPIVIGSHGLEGTKNSAKQMILSKLLPQNNIGFLRFDHRGCGESEGNFLKDTSVQNRASDFINAVKYILENEKVSNKIGIFGSSLGGSTCIEAFGTLIQMDVEICGIVLTAAPVKSRTIDNVPALPVQFLESLKFDLKKKIKQMNNILIFHGTADEVVPIENAHTIYENAKNPKKLILFKNGDHQTSSRKDQIIFEKETLEWFKAALCEEYSSM